MNERETALRKRIRFITWIFIVGLILSGVTAIPLETELALLKRWLGGAEPNAAGEWPATLAGWIGKVHHALQTTNTRFPFLAYGTDWLAFGHIVIALVFIGLLKDPVRNEWLVTFGMIACVAVIPWALVFGQIRGIPFYWRLIDCAFGVFGLIPLWLIRRDIRELDKIGSRLGKAVKEELSSGRQGGGAGDAR